MEILDLDEPGGPADPPDRAARPAWARRRWWPVVVVLLVVAVGLGVDQHSRYSETSALVAQVTRGQSALTYADGRIGSAVQYTRPNLTSARVPESVRAGLRLIVEKEAAARIAPLQVRREQVAGVSVHSWHHGQVRARAAYLAYLDQRIAVLRAMSSDLRVLFRPQPESARRLTAARDALLAITPDPKEAARLREILPAS